VLPSQPDSRCAGRAGGYALARPAADITIAQVVAAARGPGPAFRCREIRRQGPCAGPPSAYRARCAIAQLMDQAEDAWWQSLAATTLADLARLVGTQLSDPIRASAQGWLQHHARTP
jgi:DNA-binding IscR family transcriptional regulator